MLDAWSKVTRNPPESASKAATHSAFFILASVEIHVFTSFASRLSPMPVTVRTPYTLACLLARDLTFPRSVDVAWPTSYAGMAYRRPSMRPESTTKPA